MAARDILAGLKLDKAGEMPVLGYSLSERLSQVPLWQVQVEDTDTALDTLLGQRGTITLKLSAAAGRGGTEPRSFAGLVTEASRDVSEAGGAVLSLTLRPALAVLGLSIHSTVFQNASSLDILGKVLESNGLRHQRLQSSAQPAKRDVCIQYLEEDLAFIERLLSEDGLHYFFHDGNAADALVLQDGARPFPKAPGGPLKLTDALTPDPERARADNLALSRAITTAQVTLTTYDVEGAKTLVRGPGKTSSVSLRETPEVVDYVAQPAGDLDKVPQAVAQGRAQGGEARLCGVAHHPAVYLGQEIDLAAKAAPGLAGRYIVTALSYAPTGAGGHACRFEAVPVGTPLYPPRREKPRIHGVHNAVVVGDKDGAPACDDEGRVRIKFYWDTSDDTKATSPWIRVAEPYAGKGYGTQFTPRVGHEVLVAFLQGDPDAPVIVGQVHNSINAHPFMSKDTTRSGISTKLENKPNELEFDDKDGAELLALRAAKDYTLDVEESSTRTIGTDEATTVSGQASLDVSKTYDVTVSEGMTVTADTLDIKISKASTHKAQTIEMEADSKLTLTVGSSKIEMTSSGITISAAQVEIKATGSATMKGATATVQGDSSATLKGMSAEVNGDVSAKVSGGAQAEVSGAAMLTLKGGIVMIN